MDITVEFVITNERELSFGIERPLQCKFRVFLNLEGLYFTILVLNLQCRGCWVRPRITRCLFVRLEFRVFSVSLVLEC